ncbi:MAG: hypothetical protein AAGA23_08770 [Pseudomonadota bacterium]
MPELTLIGVATPQANPTVEREFRQFFAEPLVLQITRLHSAAAQPAERLAAYLEQLPAAIATFGGMSLAAFGVACTGSSYVLGAEHERELTEAATQQAGYPVVTAAQAITRELKLRGIEHFDLLSPYPESLNEAALSYWRSGGFVPTVGHRLALGEDTRAIYQLGDDAARRALAALPDASRPVLLSGTGMPTLSALACDHPAPLLSSNLCLAAELLRQAGCWPAQQLASLDRLTPAA